MKACGQWVYLFNPPQPRQFRPWRNHRDEVRLAFAHRRCPHFLKFRFILRVESMPADGWHRTQPARTTMHASSAPPSSSSSVAAASETPPRNPFGQNLAASRPRKSPQVAQVCCIADATGSSEPFARGTEQILQALAAELPQRIAQVRFGLVASRDQDCGERDEQLLTEGDAAAMHEAIGRIRYIGGDDPDETHFWSVADALNTYPWEEGPMRRKAIVLLGSSHSKPLPGMTLDQLVLALAGRRITVFVVCPREANLKQLAELTDGLYFELSNEPSPEEVRRLTQRLTASMTQTLSGAAVGTPSAEPMRL